MSGEWRAYEAALRLRGPMHIGQGRIGNVLRTRRYVTGRAVWGALTKRLTRSEAVGRGPADTTPAYRIFSDTIHNTLAYSYFYLAQETAEGLEPVWPWDERRAASYLSSYASTALVYPQQAALTGSLHEVEMILPRRTGDGAQTYLLGYIFERKQGNAYKGENERLDWRGALHDLQFGGEQGYGWGWVEPVGALREVTDGVLFGGAARFVAGDTHPTIEVDAGGALLAHTRLYDDFSAKGVVEPLVGREWYSDNPSPGRRFAGQTVATNGPCWSPGAQVTQRSRFAVGDYGIWSFIGG